MTAARDSTSDAPAPDPAGDGDPGANPGGTTTRRPSAPLPRDFVDLARRISSRTTDLLAVAIVLVVTLSVAWRVTDWWRDDAAASTLPARNVTTGPWDAPGGADLEFIGQPWTLHREVVGGDRDSAARAVRDACRAILSASSHSGAALDLDETERTLLERLAVFATVEQDGPSSLYEVGGTLPWFIGTRDAEGDSVTPAPASDGHGPTAAAPRRRVICWGLALPQGGDRWTIYVIDRHPSAGGPAAPGPELTLPQGLRAIVTMRDKTGGMFRVLSGRGSPDRWREEFDHTFARNGWRPLRHWNGTGATQSAAWSAPAGSTPRTADVALQRDGDGAWTAVISVAPDATTITESDTP